MTGGGDIHDEVAGMFQEHDSDFFFTDLRKSLFELLFGTTDVGALVTSDLSNWYSQCDEAE